MPSKDKPETTSGSAAAPGQKLAFSLISTQKLLQIYSTMVKCRMIGERAQLFTGRRELEADGHGRWGNEAVIVSAAIDLGPEDAIVSLHDELMCGFVRGTPIDELFRALSSRSTRPGKTRSMAARQLKSAIKAALKSEKDRSGNIAVVFSHIRSRWWRDALTIARRKALPMIFVCHGDGPHEPGSAKPQAAMKVNSRRPSRGPLDFRPAFEVDCNDAIAVYRVAHEAIARARKNRGPSLIECAPYSVSGRSGKGPSKARATGAGIDTAAGDEASDPIPIMESYLATKGLFTAGMRHRIVRGFRKELGAALDRGSAPQTKPGRRGVPTETCLARSEPAVSFEDRPREQMKRS